MVTKPMGPVAVDLGNLGETRGARVPRAVPARLNSPRAVLSRTIAEEIIPRLLLVHRNAPTAEEARRPPVDGTDVAALATALLADDGPAAEEAVEAVRGRGATLEHVALDLMAPAARRLGTMWVEDDCSYTDVTLGIWRLQRILRGLSPLFESRADQVRGGTRRALITVMPGENHSFGTDIVAGFLRLAGWEVSNEPSGTSAELAKRVRHDPARIIGLSCGCIEDLEPLATLVSAVRRAAAQPVGVMVGGQVFAKAPRRALRLGADAVAHDARHAVRQAERLLQLLDFAH
ncbi:B12-binding domain-containing protein [Roseomonas sp. CCTCC AB2023176]|uniref:cobalamin B12-binding domain-containing protein n=1 Tax=Roseomonas sp. CCTCC AB2023176 TaxID=3342640 RepID=UPI0035E0CBD9